MNLERENIPFSQNYVFPREGFRHLFGIVLAGHADHGPGGRQRAQQLLVKTVDLAVVVEVPRDSFWPALLENSAPHGFVKIGDEPLLGKRVPQEAGYQLGEHRGVGERIGKSREEIRLDIQAGGVRKHVDSLRVHDPDILNASY